MYRNARIENSKSAKYVKELNNSYVQQKNNAILITKNLTKYFQTNVKMDIIRYLHLKVVIIKNLAERNQHFLIAVSGEKRNDQKLSLEISKNK